MKGYSKLKIDELRDRLAEHMLTPEVIRARLRLLSDEQVALVRQAAANNGVFDNSRPETVDDVNIICTTKYAVVTSEDTRLIIPDDAREPIMAVLDDEQFNQDRLQTEWLIECLDVTPYIYGICTLKQVADIYNNRPGMSADYDEIIEMVHNLPENWYLPSVDGDEVSDPGRSDDDLRHIRSMQKSREDYYIPEYDEIHDIVRHSYISKAPEYAALSDLLKSKGFASDRADFTMRKLFECFSAGFEISDGIDVIDSENCGVNATFDEKELSAKVAAVYLNTPQLFMKGHKLAEGAANNSSSSVRKITVRPNDPCPCGSGKKFKKCCMNRSAIA
jgi:hypothetical protein